jgi:DNA-directed RNA polymerase omega subunit
MAKPKAKAKAKAKVKAKAKAKAKEPTEEMNRYQLVILAAQRARQLLAGVQARIDPKGHKPTEVAVDEVKEGLVEWQEKDANDQPEKKAKKKK